MTLQHAGDCKGDTIPAFAMFLELSAAGRGKSVILGAAIVFGGLPLGLELPVLLQPVQRAEQRAWINVELVVT